MRTQRAGTIGAVVGIACAGSAARADTGDDIKNATQLYMHYAHVTVDGVPNEATAVPFVKPAGTLTFDIPASALGFPNPSLLVHAVGTPIGGGKISFTSATTYDPPITIDDAGTTVSSERGSFTMQTWALRGADTPTCGRQPCSGGTAFKVLGGVLVVYGSFGMKTIALDELRGLGGVPRAAITRLYPPPLHLSGRTPELPFCSSATDTHALMTIELAGPAQVGGARVDLSSPTGGLRFTRTLVVPEGRDSLETDVVVPPNFTGTLEVSAAAGGRKSTATLAVGPAGTCRPPPRRFALEALANPSEVGCASCAAFGALDNEGDRIITVAGALELVHAGVYTPLAPVLGASTVTAAAINAAGQITGRLTRDGVTQAYRADTLHGAHAPILLGAMTPTAIAPGGAVVGYRVDPATGSPIAVTNRGFGIADLALSSSYGVRASRALFMVQDGTIVGTYTGNDGVVRGFRFHHNVTTTLPAIGPVPAIPAGLAEDGSIAVNAGTVAAVIAQNGAISYYGSPAGTPQFVVKGINKWGYAIGTSTTSAGQRAYVYIPGTGFVALSGYVTNLAYADDALAINDDNQIVLHGQLTGGHPDDYLLSL